MKKTLLVFLVIFLQNIWAQSELDALIDGLHQDAHEGNFQTYFDRYSVDAIFLGTDKTERWTVEEFKAYAEPAFQTAMDGPMKWWSVIGKAVVARVGLMKFYSMKS